MNRENIQKVRDVIAGLDPKRFNMSMWSAERRGENDVPPAQLVHDCGTCGCIGGWTNAVFKTPRSRMGARSATEQLGLSDEIAYRLFYPWSAGPSVAWTTIKPAHAVRVLDHLLATGEVDWKSTRRAKKAPSAGPASPKSQSIQALEDQNPNLTREDRS